MIISSIHRVFGWIGDFDKAVKDVVNEHKDNDRFVHYGNDLDDATNQLDNTITSLNKTDIQQKREELVGKLKATVEDTFKVAESMVNSSNELLVTLLRKFVNKMGTEIVNIPVISELWSNTTDTKLSVANLFALFASVPSTILVHSYSNRTLVPAGMLEPLTTWTPTDLKDYYIDRYS